MTKVAGIPEQLRDLAATLVASSPELGIAATLLGRSALPEMPPSVAAEIQTRIDQAMAAIRRAAATSLREGEDLKRRGLWLEVADRLEALWTPSATAFAMVNTPLDAIEGLERWRVAKLMQTWGEYSREVLPAATATSGGEDSLEALNASLRFRELRPRLSPSSFNTIVEGAGSLESYEGGLGPLATFAESTGKYLGPVGLVSGFVQVLRPEHAHGGLMVADRAAGGATMLGSGASMAIELGLIELGPLGVGVVAGVLVVAGVWELYENRAEVAKLTVAGAKFVADHAYVLAGPAGIAGKELWDHRRAVARAAVTTLKDTAGVAEAGANVVVDGVKNDISDAKSVVSGGVSAGKNLLGHVGIHW